MGKADSLLILVVPSLLVWVGWIFIKRQLYRKFPFFFIYICSAILVSVLRLSVIGDYRLYFKVFWSTEGLYALLSLLALHEVFRYIFIEFYDLWWWSRLIFPSLVGVLGFVKISNALQHPPAQASPVVALILSFGTTVSWVQIGLFVVFGALFFLLGSWENYPMGIVLGFAAISLGSWAAFSARSILGTNFNLLAKYGPPVAYIVAALIWLFTFNRRPRPERWEALSKLITPEAMLKEMREFVRILKGPYTRSR
jgi:hypothetical protein